MNTNTGLFQHPTTSLLVQVRHIAESPGRQEVAFDVLDPGLHDPFLRRIRRRTRIYFEPILFSARCIRSLHDRISDAGASDRTLGIVNDDQSWNGTKPL